MNTDDHPSGTGQAACPAGAAGPGGPGEPGGLPSPGDLFGPGGLPSPGDLFGPGDLRGPGLDETMLAPDPVAQFSGWLADAAAAGLPEPNAMVLSTVTDAARPRARSVLLKSHGQDGFVFYTNRTSAKAQDLSGNPWACLLFPWYALHRQVIIQGAVSPLSEAESEPYFHYRAHGSQLGAWASRQSSVIGSRAVLDDRYARLEQRWPEGTIVPMPSFWGGYRLRHDIVEFWQGRVNRLHDRLRYRREGTHWAVERLAP
ncbi:MAG TPA: pyridoxamine 5'-phosphate oxidase [Streptosporangiaceae bacterium]|nr:pyridoxamine 5'-phosphate oxidase [Streptosporangiaceae bacterium]